MIKEAIGIAATIDEARKIATQNLNAPIDADVKVEIVSMPKKKVLGLFGGADCHTDHRIPMSLAVASQRCKNPVILNGAECVSKSYPTFFEDFRKLGGIADVI